MTREKLEELLEEMSEAHADEDGGFEAICGKLAIGPEDWVRLVAEETMDTFRSFAIEEKGVDPETGEGEMGSITTQEILALMATEFELGIALGMEVTRRGLVPA